MERSLKLLLFGIAILLAANVLATFAVGTSGFDIAALAALAVGLGVAIVGVSAKPGAE